MAEDENWKAALTAFLKAITELAKLGAQALKEELANKEHGAPAATPRRQ